MTIIVSCLRVTNYEGRQYDLAISLVPLKKHDSSMINILVIDIEKCISCRHLLSLANSSMKLIFALGLKTETGESGLDGNEVFIVINVDDCFHLI